MLKTNPQSYIIKDLNEETIIGSYYEKELFSSKPKRSYYPEPDSCIRDKVNTLLELSNYYTKEEIEHGPDVATFNLADKKDFVALKAEIDKAD